MIPAIGARGMSSKQRRYMGRVCLMMALDEIRYSAQERAEARLVAYELNPPSNPMPQRIDNGKWHPRRELRGAA